MDTRAHIVSLSLFCAFPWIPTSIAWACEPVPLLPHARAKVSMAGGSPASDNWVTFPVERDDPNHRAEILVSSGHAHRTPRYIIQGSATISPIYPEHLEHQSTTIGASSTLGKERKSSRPSPCLHCRSTLAVGVGLHHYHAVITYRLALGHRGRQCPRNCSPESPVCRDPHLAVVGVPSSPNPVSKVSHSFVATTS